MIADYLGLLLADGRLPVGAHTQSAGVEPAFQAGLALEQLPAYLEVRLRTVTEVEAATAVVARHAWLSGSQSSPPGSGHGTARPAPATRFEPVVGQRLAAAPTMRSEPVEGRRVQRLVEIDRGWRARTASDAIRDASDLLGRGYLRLGTRLWGLGALAARTWCRPVVLGVMAAEARLDPAQTARLVGFEDVQTAIAAALKLRPFDPALGAAWSMAAARLVEDMVARVAGLTDPDDIPAYAAPQLEHWAQLHKTSGRRLFRA
jgi:urease accessory protein